MDLPIPDKQVSIGDISRDHVINAKTQCFNQDGYKVLCKLEELLCNAKYTFRDYSDVLQLYADHFNHKHLASSILMLQL